MKTFFYYFDKLNFPWIFLFFDLSMLGVSLYRSQWDWCVVWVVLATIQAGVIELMRGYDQKNL